MEPVRCNWVFMAIVEHGTAQKADSQTQELALNILQSDGEISTIERPNNNTWGECGIEFLMCLRS